ncbi:MAG: AbrB/MazE/SpoVT family DNA-binding domain-containing protein [Rhizomicrobium sp.]
MDEIVAATGGFQYNVLRRLEQRGYLVRKVREGRVTRYWAMPPAVRSYKLKVGTNGQTTLPREIRDRLGVRSGGELEATLEDGKVVIGRGSIGLERLIGILHRPEMRAKTIDEMDEGVASAVKARHARASGGGR